VKLVHKPIYLMPFIFVYRVVSFVILLPFKLVNYFLLGFFVVFYLFMSYLLTIIENIFKLTIIIFKYSFKGLKTIYLLIKKSTSKLFVGVYKLTIKYPFLGFVYISYLVYRFIHYFFYGFYSIYLFIQKYNKNLKEQVKKQNEKRKELERKQQEAKQKEQEEKEKIRKEKEEALKSKRTEIIAERKKRKELDNYQNENVVIEKKTFGDKINAVLVSIIQIPANFIAKIKESYNNSALVKNMRNKRDIEREKLLVSFESESDERSNIKQLYEYTAKNPDGKTVTGYFDAYSRVEVHSFLLSEGFEVYSIKTNDWIRLMHGASGSFKTKIKTRDLVFFLTQLSTYIKAGITLVDSLKILTNQFKNKGYQRVFRSLIYDLTMGDSFSEALTKQGDAFPKILINMVKAAEMTGELPEVLDDMAEYFTQIDKTKKQMVTVMMYPAVIFVIAVGVIAFILLFVIPRFVQIYESIDSSQIPAFTRFIIDASAFLKVYAWAIVLGAIVFIFIFRYMYKNVKLFKTFMQWIVMHVPGFGQIIIYNEVTMFSKTFSSLLSHNVFITESMDILNKITNNEIYKMLILDTITNLAKGDKISESFKSHWAFPMPAYEMIVTGEKTGELPEMMQKVSEYYQEQHSNSIARLKTFVEPALIIFLTVVVGLIVLAIIIPMFNMYQAVQG
jgi:type IV pilus assembly protein PilC